MFSLHFTCQGHIWQDSHKHTIIAFLTSDARYVYIFHFGQLSPFSFRYIIQWVSWVVCDWCHICVHGLSQWCNSTHLLITQLGRLGMERMCMCRVEHVLYQVG